jgi:hypothetical protein
MDSNMPLFINMTQSNGKSSCMLIKNCQNHGFLPICDFIYNDKPTIGKLRC